MKKKICVVTGSRADYGLLSYFLKEAKKKFNLSLVVTGSHLNSSFGKSLNEIKKDGIGISKKIDLDINDRKGAVANSLSIGIKKFNAYFQKNTFDYVILLGDRYEILSAAIAAAIIRCPIAHLHGGETTTNSYDEYFRHSISIFSFLHFVAAAKYYNRLIQLGNNPKNIYLVGGMGPSNITRMEFLDRKNIEKKLKIKFKEKNIFAIYHPETLEKNYGILGLKNLLKVLSKYKNYLIIISLPNADTDHFRFKQLILSYGKKYKHLKIISSLNHELFLSCLKHMSVLVGNSSSGLIEAPSLKIPTLNIGQRQGGRLKAKSVIDCGYGEREINYNLRKAINIKKNNSSMFRNPYDHGDGIKKIIKVLQARKMPKSNPKVFFDITKKYCNNKFFKKEF